MTRMQTAWAACLVGGCGYRPGQSWEVADGLLALMLLGIPLVVAAFFGLFAFRRLTPYVFHCRRCDRPFHGRADRDFPDACPHCGDRDWNRPPSA